MGDPDEGLERCRTALFVPIELQRRGFMNRVVFTDLAERAFEPVPKGVKQVQPWCRWQGLSQYLDCVAFADRAAREIPTGSALDLTHITPGRFYSVAIVLFTQALIDNLAVWLCDAVSLPVAGGDRHFLSSRFTRELVRKLPPAHAELEKHRAFVAETNRYRQVWIHTISGGAIPTSDVDPFQHPETARKFLGVPLDPAIQPDQENYRKRAEECAGKNSGRYLYEIGDFTNRVFAAASEFYLGWLRLALDHITA
jgi:hypothetical protein